MRARARVEARVDASGCTRLLALRSEAPLVLRPAADGMLWLAGGAAGPLAGDDLVLEVVVGAGARLVVRSVAASVAQPGPGPRPSRLGVTVEVGDGGHLDWRPEPLVLARGCDHEVVADVVLGEGAGLVWREEVVLGRHGESPGSFRSRLRVDRGGHPLFRQDLGLGSGHPGGDGPAVVGGAKVVGSVLWIPPTPSRSNREDRCGWMPRECSRFEGRCEVMGLAGGVGVLVSALGARATAVRAALDAESPGETLGPEPPLARVGSGASWPSSYASGRRALLPGPHPPGRSRSRT